MTRFSLPLLALLALANVSCDEPPEVPVADSPAIGPTAMSSTGYETLSIQTTVVDVAPAEVRAVLIGGILALDLEVVDDEWITVTSQGSPAPGPAAIDLVLSDVSVRHPDTLDYAAPIDPRLERVVAFGASLTQGVQDGTPTHDGVLMSPSLQLARVMGAYMPQPVLIDDLFPTLGLDSVGPPPECASTNVADFIRNAITDVLVQMVDPEEGLAYWVARSDPDMSVRNLAAGNFMVDDMLLGPSADELVQNVLGSLSLDPYAPFGGAPRWTMIEAVERLEPTVVVSFDLVGNDVLSGTAVEDMEENLPPLIARLAATGAEVFLADMPDISILRGSLGDEPLGEDEQSLADEVNAVLYAEVDRHDNVHVVPVAERALQIATDGLELGDQTLNGEMLGGILSFDGLHFSSTGYALVADMFVDTINNELGTAVPAIDVAAVLAEDIHSPNAVLDAGRDGSLCGVE
ncbi:MAG: hypothetical protein KDA24_02615 [Deltaproteobacteria bacterium]|nr:hypothetical protein [Deltaproteobacteria bacterium]